MMASNDHNQETAEPVAPSRARRRLWWSVGVVVVLLVLVVTPPLLNVNRLRRRIATSMSASLGRPVHLDGVTLQLLPIPGFTLQNLVVSEDPAFGNEPVIRANVVEITLRPSSLWRRQVELSSIRFVEPSLNLVRNAQGQWNLQGLLMHAAQMNTAPTEQSNAGAAPRFPYIEATNGRVNVKLADEKQPFSLTAADFALWLPSENQWQVRLKGQPLRTDMNVANAGTMRLEGSLQRAATVGDVPVELTASWHDAPLGEASKLLSGVDAGWRGTLNADATLTGPLSAAKLATHFHLNDLRRADFVPVRLLDISVECNGSVDVTNTVVHDPSCTMPTNASSSIWLRPDHPAPSKVVAIADALQLQELDASDHGLSGLRLGMTGVPDSYVLDWSRLFSQRIPVQYAPRGTVAGSMTYSADGQGWQGEFHATVDGAMPWEPKAAAAVETSAARGGSAAAAVPVAPQTTIMVTANQGALTLAPLNLTPASRNLTPAAKAGGLELTGSATRQGYTLQLAGTGDAAQLWSIFGTLPALSDGAAAVVPALRDAGDKPLKVDVTCVRAWGGLQSCTAATVSAVPVKAKRARRR